METVLADKKEHYGHFEALFMNATLCILLTDMSGYLTAVNPFALKEFGYSNEDELTGKKIEVLIPERFRRKHEDYHKQYFEKPRAVSMGGERQIFALKKNGAEFPVEISLSPYQYNGDKFVIVFLNDISEKRNAEEKLKELNNKLEAAVRERTKELGETQGQLRSSKTKLEETKAFHRTLLEYAGAIIISTDVKGVIKTFNPEAEKCLGYSADEMIGKCTPVIFHCPEETRLRSLQFSKEFSENIEPGFETYVAKAKRNVPHEDEWTYVRKDGTRFPVSLIVTALRNNNDQITGYIGVAVDISEHKEEEENLRRSLVKEKELSELKSRFVSMASHEFRTPLSTVLSSAYLIEKYTGADEQAKREKHLQRIVSSVNMLTDILDDFLSVGKIEEGKIHTRFSEFNIQHLVEGIIEEIKPSLKNGQVIHYTHKGNQVVKLDQSLMKHIVMNLLSNARKFSPENSEVEMGTFYNKGVLLLKIKDYGIGISEEDMQHLTERFFRGTNAVNIQGTGLGLHIVSKYAELMNGKMECKSELEKGSEFILTFNLKTDTGEKNFADRG